MKLYYVPGVCSLAPHIALREAGLRFVLDRLDRETRITESGENYANVNPKGHVPALRLDDGTVLTENAVILQYIADRVPESGLAPAAGSMERYRLMEWLNFIATDVHKQFSPMFNPKLPPEWRDNQLAVLSKKFDYLSTRLEKQNYLMGDRFTIADAYLFAVLRWGERFRIDPSPWPVLVRFRDNITERPAVTETLRAEGLLPGQTSNAPKTSTSTTQ